MPVDLEENFLPRTVLRTGNEFAGQDDALWIEDEWQQSHQVVGRGLHGKIAYPGILQQVGAQNFDHLTRGFFDAITFNNRVGLDPFSKR